MNYLVIKNINQVYSFYVLSINRTCCCLVRIKGVMPFCFSNGEGMEDNAA